MCVLRVNSTDEIGIYMLQRILIGIVGVFFICLLALLVFIWTKPTEEIKQKYIRELKNLDRAEISSISIFAERKTYRDNDNAPIKILSKEEIIDFLNILKTLEKSNTSHPHFIKGWDIVISFKNGGNKEIKVYLERDDNNYLYMRSSGDKLFEGTGELKSKKLYRWMKNLMGTY